MVLMLCLVGLFDLLYKIRVLSELPKVIMDQLNDKQIKRLIAIINSMTPHERRFPDIIKGSRKRRIAQGSGTQVQEVNKLLKQFSQTQKMMKKVSKGGMAKMMRGMKGRFPMGGMGGGMPPFH